MENSRIQWTHHTFNGWIGCSHKSKHPGCAHCYAEDEQADRRGRVVWGPKGTRSMTRPDYWKNPLRWNEEARRSGIRKRVFAFSLADVFEDWKGYVTQKWMDEGRSHQRMITMDQARQELFQLIDATQYLDWLLLTKRPENVRAMWWPPDRDTHKYLKIDKEEVREVKGFSGYFVSNLGTVYTTNGSSHCLRCGTPLEGFTRKKYCSPACRQAMWKAGKTSVPDDAKVPLSPDIGEEGHCRVTLFRDGQRFRMLVHRLVLAAFVREPGAHEEGCHRDRNPMNNRVDNLRWDSQAGNQTDRRRHGTHQSYIKITPAQVAEIRDKAADGQSFASLGIEHGISGTQISNIVNERHWKNYDSLRRDNCWIGTSISDQATADQYIPELLKLRGLAPVLFVSAEPLLSQVDLTNILLPGPGKKSPTLNALEGRVYHEDGVTRDASLDWLIVGGESGSKARPFNLQWGRDLISQCTTADVPVPVFMKQVGSNPQEENVYTPSDSNEPEKVTRFHKMKDKKGGNPDEWPAALRVREIPHINRRDYL